MSDIVERLRECPHKPCPRCNEAADEIERLRERCEAYKGQVQAGAVEIERLQEAKRRALAIADERSRENVALRAALREIIDLKPEDMPHSVENSMAAAIARAVLDEQSPAGEK